MPVNLELVVNILLRRIAPIQNVWHYALGMDRIGYGHLAPIFGCF